jgi:hypothetical protein
LSAIEGDCRSLVGGESEVNEGRSYRIETFDPLLRDLVVWGLVAKSEVEAGRWQLTDAAQRRLDEIVEPTRPLPPDQLVYLDRLCADCRFRGRTRLCDGVYLCEECAQRRTASVMDEEGSSPPVVRKDRWRRHGHAVDGRTPLAG